MNNGWVKLHRKTLGSQIRRSDPTAWRIFETLLLLVDKETGEWQGGRRQLAYADGVVKEGAIYPALKRLERATMVGMTSNNQFTTYRICKWGHYQTNSNNVTTTLQQPNNTLTISKKKEVRNIYKSNDLVKTQSVYDLYIKLFDKNPKTYKLTDKRKAKIRTRLKDAGYEMLVKAIESVADMPFYRGDNDRGWKADLDFIINSYEKVERLSQLSEESKITEGKAKWYYE